MVRLEILEERCNPAQLFWNNLSPSLGGSPMAIVQGDFNQDGKLDFAAGTNKSLTIGLGQGIGSFGPTRTITLGDSPRSLAVADMNGDGKLDLIAVNQATETITFLQGLGDGTFAMGKSVPVGAAPVSVAIADFNGDNQPDLAVANSGSGSVSILLGNGNGGFALTSNLQVGTGVLPSWVSIGDFNNDKKADLAVANSSANSVSIFLGNGDGTFSSVAPISVGNFPSSIAIGDFNKDGNPDLATANYTGNSVSISLGKGDGTFNSATAISLGASSGPQTISVGDFNRDGSLDLVTGNYFGNSVSILNGNGKGAFNSPANYSVGTGPQSLTVGDFDNDTRLDIAIANNSDSSVSFLFGKFDGAFFPATTLLLGSDPAAVATGDFNGDGKKDIVTANKDGSSLSLLIGKGDGSFQYPLALAVGTKPNALTVGDFNGDNKLDIACVNSSSNTISILFGFGDGTFQFPQTIKGLSNPTAIASANLNGDSKLDLVVANSGTNSLLVFLANANGNYNPPFSLPVGASPQSLTLADFNGDKNIDIACANLGANTVSVLNGNGDGSFKTPISLSVGTAPQGIGSGDANGDGFLDLVVANSGSDTLSLLPGNGNGTFKPAISLNVGNNPNSATIVDMDGDGKKDLLSTDGSASTITVLLGNANGTWKSAKAFGVGTNPRQLAVEDFNGDSKPDLVTPNQGDGTLSILLATGAGQFQSSSSFEVGPSPWTVVRGDFNGDGKQDLATANSGNNTVSVLPGLGDGSFGPAKSYPVDSSPMTVSVGDLNGDGKPDLFTANNVGNTVSFLLGNGDGTFKAAKLIGVGSNPTAARSGDVNGDGKQDLLTTNSGDNSISIALGNGDGTFKAAKSIPAGGISPNDLLILDLNGDQKPDLVSSNSGSNSLTTLMGNGDGTFKTPTSSGVGANPYSISSADFNGDLKIDLVTANAGGTSVSVLLGNGNGTFQPSAAMAAGVNPWSVTTGDVNGDANVDIITANSGDNTISVLQGDGLGGFQSPDTYSVGSNPYSVLLGDFNNDRRADLAVSNFNGSTVSVLLGISSVSPAFVSPATARFTEKRTGQFFLQASGSPAPVFNLKSGTLPTGLTFDPLTGRLSGKPAKGTPGDYSLTFEAANGIGTPATQNFTLTVDPSPGDPPVFTSTPATTFEYGKTGTFTFQTEGSPNPKFSITTGSLPTGITLDAGTGVLTGKTNAGLYNFTITASNGIGDPVTQDFTLTVNKAALTITADKQMKVYGDVLPVLTATFTGLVNGDTPAAITGLILTTSALNTSKVGDYPINAGKATSANYTITMVNSVLTVTPAALTIKPDDKLKVYGAALPALSASFTGLVNGDKSTVVTGLTLATTALASSIVGDYKISAANATASNYSITFVDGKLSITKAALTIKPDDKTKVYAAALPALSASFTGLVNGDKSTVVTGLTLGTTALASSNVGDYKISGANATASNYSITFVDGKLSITKAALTIKPDDKTKVYAAALPALTASFTGLVNGDKSTVVTGLTLGTTALASSKVGDYKISGANATASNYSITYVDGKLSITKAALTIKPDDKTKLYGAAIPPLTVTYTGLVNGDKSTVVSGLALSTSALASSIVGDYKITASKATASNYTITFVDGKLSVTRAALSIKADDKIKVYGAALPGLTATYTGLVNGDKSTVVSGLALATTALASSNFGDYKITASKGTASNYTITFVDGKLSVTRAALSIKADDKIKVYGAALPALTTTISGLVNGDTSSVVSGLTVSTTALASSNVGDYKISASKATATNYAITFVDGKLSISKAALTIKADDKAILPGAAIPTLTAAYIGLVNGDKSSVVSGVTLSTTATTSSPKGTYPIKVTGGTATNYTISPVNGVLTIGEIPQISSSPSTAFTYGSPGSFNFTATGVLPSTFQVSSGNLPAGLVLDLKSGVLSGTPAANAGTYKFSVTPSNVLGVGSAQAFTLTINKAALKITANNLSRLFGASNPTLTATYAGLVNGDTSGVVSGLVLSTVATPTSKAGAYAITARGATATNYTITLVDGLLSVNQSPAFTSANNTRFTAGKASSFTLAVSGFPAATFSIFSGALPAGVSLNGLTGTLSSLFSAKAGTYTFTLQATNGIGNPATQLFTLTIQ